MSNKNEVPILFLVFNRPETEKKVFEVIKKIRPSELYVAADGPRKNKKVELERCREARRLIDEGIDWNCKVHKLYRNKNLGCKIAVSSAIDWFFENVEEGIILEDDCLPDSSFFEFCSIMLEKYRHDEKIMHISGDNYQPELSKLPNSYYFSRYPNIWGWATWRRAWNKYSVSLENWRKENLKNIFSNMSLLEKLYWSNNFDLVEKGLVSTWDYQWVLTLFKANGYSINPNVNLIENIGFGNGATHTTTTRGPKFVRHKLKFPIIHPRDITIDKNKDDYLKFKMFNINIFIVLYQYLKIVGLIKI